jgi:hypothetical protein
LAVGPEQFMGFINLVTYATAADAASREQRTIDIKTFSRELTGIMVREFNIDIRPYRDLEEVCNCCTLKGGVMKKLEDILEKISQDDALFDLAESSGVLPSVKTRFAAITYNLLGKEVVNRLRPYINFV